VSIASDGEGSVSFVQYLLPALESGDFSVTATQVVSVFGDGETLQAKQSFVIKGLRYGLDDAGVDSVFPPPGSQGEFGNVLPHVVLTDPTLPWQRSPSASPAKQGDPVPSWLALLLFDEEDPPPQPQAKTIADLVSDAHVFVPPRTAEYGEKASEPVTVIDVPAGLYAQITPSLADLNWLAHTRLVQPAAKVTAEDAASPTELAVVVGSRLPATGRVSTAFLVSLEGFGPYLPDENGVAPTTLPAAATAVRLVVLRSWAFSAIQLKQSFQGILQALNTTPSSLQRPVRAASSDDVDPAVQQAFGMGYTALDHGLRDGSATVSWYRGPLLPLGVTASPPASAQASDELLRYDPENGMFDVSYAAAWELGRLLALRDRAYATALFRWKLTVTQQAAAKLEDDIVDQLLPPLAGDQASDERLALLPTAQRRLARVIRDVVGPAAGRIAEGGG
jgi:hypothetical protein